MSFRRRLKGKAPPEGFEMIEQAIEDFENQMKDAVNEQSAHFRLQRRTSIFSLPHCRLGADNDVAENPRREPVILSIGGRKIGPVIAASSL